MKRLHQLALDRASHRSAEVVDSLLDGTSVAA